MAKGVKAIVRSIKLRKWFPPDDPIASAVARLCLLREDFYLEGLAMAADEIEQLDRNGHQWRQLYFLRQIMKTMMEARSAMMTLEQSRDFQTALGQAGAGFREEVKQFLSIADSDDLKEIRNNIGGHILLKAVARTLQGLHWDTEGLLDVGRTHAETHFKFTSELMALMLTVHCEGKEERLTALDRLGKLASAKLLDAVDRIIIAYCEMKRLI
jgi:hypothetical protein